MELKISSLIGYNMGATDGLIGEVKDFYFDDESWTIRYLIIKTGNWVSGRKVLISTSALVKTTWKTGTFTVSLTTEQIRHSPGIDTDKPVFRQHEKTLNDYYHWQTYWGDGFYVGGIWGPPPAAANKNGLNDQKKIDETSRDDQHLRSCDQVMGYHIHTSDGGTGHLNDFIIDKETWQVKFIVVDTHNWFGGKKVLIPVEQIEKVDWSTFGVFLNITVAGVKNSSVFRKSEFVMP